MSDGKRYYWLRLHDDFFSSIRIKKLRKMAGGDTYVIIYLKMQLKAMNTDGVLSYKGYEQDFVDELALDLDEEPDNIRVTLAYLLSCGLAETDGGTNFFLPYAVENTGSETASTQRVRDFRARQKELPQAIVPATQPKTNAERQKAFRAKQSCEQKQHIPFIEDHMNRTRYGGNYYLVCQREHFKCAICDGIENLCVHHIDGFDETRPENNALNKMVLLCRSCHAKVHAGTPIPQDILDAIDYDSNVTCNADVTEVKRICNAEKEIEIDTRDIDRDRDKGGSGGKTKFSPPTLEEVKAYCRERNNSVDAQRFLDYYTSNGWKVGKNPMKDWKAAVRTWEREDKQKPKNKTPYDNLRTEMDGDDADKLARRFGIG